MRRAIGQGDSAMRQTPAAAIASKPGSFGRPRLVTPTDHVIRVEAGYVDLFLVEISDGVPSGVRRHVMRVEAGGVIFGTALIAAAGMPSCGLLAVGGLGCEILTRPRGRLLAEAEAATTARAIDGWITGLAQAALASPELGRHTLARPGAQLDLAKDAVIRAAPRSVVWLSVIRGALASSDLARSLADEPGDALLPITEEMSATASEPSIVLCLDTETALGRAPYGIDQEIETFNMRILARLAARFAAEDAALIDRRREGRQAAEQAVLADFLQLAIAAGSRSEIARTAIAADPDPAVSSSRLVAAALGIELVVPPLGSGTPTSPLEKVLQIAAAANIRCRRVVLRGRWWRGDHGPMVGFRGTGQSPVALLPKSPGRYHLVDPRIGEDRSIDAAIVGELSGEAVGFYRPLPPGPVGIWRLIGFMKAGTARDRLTIMLGSLAIGVLALAGPLATGLIFDTIVPNAEINLLLELGRRIGCRRPRKRHVRSGSDDRAHPRREPDRMDASSRDPRPASLPPRVLLQGLQLGRPGRSAARIRCHAPGPHRQRGDLGRRDHLLAVQLHPASSRSMRGSPWWRRGWSASPSR